MTAWTTRPRDDSDPANYGVIRTPQGRPIKLVILSHEHVGVYTHYWKGRTTVCEGPDCEACKAGRSPRWYGYVFGFNPKTNTTSIFEFPRRAFDAFDTLYTEHGTQRGAVMTAERLNSRPNGPVQISFAPELWTETRLPDVVDLRSILCRLWEVTDDRKQAMHGPQHDETLTQPAKRGHNE